MTSGRLRFLTLLALIAATVPGLRADVTLRFKTEIKANPALPPQILGAAMKGVDQSAPQETVLYLRNGKGYSSAANGFNTVVDFTTQEVTFLDSAGKRYAKLKSDQLADEMARTIPDLPPDAQIAMASMKTTVTPAKMTGRTAVIQGVDTEEEEIVFSIEGPAIPNMPAGPMVRMAMQLWLPKSGELARVAAIREMTGYSLAAYAAMNPMASLDKMMKQLPGFAGMFEMLMKESQKGSPVMRTHVDMFMPAIAAMMRQMPAGNNPLGPLAFDGDAPLMQVNMEASELSSAPVDDAVFKVPADYQEAPAADLIRSMMAKAQPMTKP